VSLGPVPTLTFDGYIVFLPVHRMTGVEAAVFGARTGKYPDPAALNLPTIAALKAQDGHHVNPGGPTWSSSSRNCWR
jgi:hypothetical protein